jgi:hypothetical protein
MSFTQEEKIRIGRLQNLCNKYGDFKVAIANKKSDGSMFWTKHKSVLECWETEKGIWFLSKANNRQILPCEIVIDLDEEIAITKLDYFQKILERNYEEYAIYHTGSRGYHIHIKDKNLATLPIRKREMVRELFIKGMLGDVAKKNEVMIALEDCPHWKTGNQKVMVRYSYKWEGF